jgi:hypothetical protein
MLPEIDPEGGKVHFVARWRRMPGSLRFSWRAVRRPARGKMLSSFWLV